MEQVGDSRPARVLDNDSVARPELGLEDAFDSVQRAAGDRDLALDPVGGEVLLGELDESRQLGRPPVELVLGHDAGQRVRERRKERRIRVPARQVADARRQSDGALHAHGRDGGDRGSAAALGHDEATLLERPVGGGDRGRADVERAGERADGRKPRLGCQETVRDLFLDRRRDGCGAGAAFDSLY